MGSLTGLLQTQAATMAVGLQETMSGKLGDLLGAVNLAAVPTDELALLREVAAAAAGGGDVSAALSKLRAHHLKQAEAAAASAHS